MTVSANESRKIMERIGFPQEAVDTIGDCTERVSENADFNALVDEFSTRIIASNSVFTTSWIESWTKGVVS